MLDKSFIPRKPFAEFKWQWATLTPTESINDPVVLLGVLFRLERLEGKYSFSSDEFTQELQSLSNDIKDSIGVNLARRGGDRNVMRNSQQYWKSLSLIPKDTHGLIQLTDFGRKVARREISRAVRLNSSMTAKRSPLNNRVVRSTPGEAEGRTTTLKGSPYTAAGALFQSAFVVFLLPQVLRTLRLLSEDAFSVFQPHRSKFRRQSSRQ